VAQDNLGGYDIVTVELNEWTPASSSSQDMSGYAGQEVIINGANFDTTGLAQVLFGGFPSPNVTCPTTTQCTATASPGVFIPGPLPVTIDVMGLTTNVGNFTYLPSGPGCTYTAGPTNRSEGYFMANCTPDSLGDPIWIFRLNESGGWNFAYDYPVSSGSTDKSTSITAVGSHGASGKGG
jgi:hypothetical protein